MTGRVRVDLIITELAVIEVTPQGLVLREVAPGVTPEKRYKGSPNRNYAGCGGLERPFRCKILYARSQGKNEHPQNLILWNLSIVIFEPSHAQGKIVGRARLDKCIGRHHSGNRS